jgi:hypothetical protein
MVYSLKHAHSHSRSRGSPTTIRIKNNFFAATLYKANAMNPCCTTNTLFQTTLGRVARFHGLDAGGSCSSNNSALRT